MSMVRILVGAITLTLAACSAEPDAGLPLDPVPFTMNVPAGILSRLETGPIEGPFAQEVEQAGALAATTVYYKPVEAGERAIFLTAYWFPEDKFDILQKPDEPPMFGFEVLRAGGKVLSVAGPVDSIFAPDTPDGKNLTEVYGLIYLPATYRSAE